jgi:hypothetical protein
VSYKPLVASSILAGATEWEDSFCDTWDGVLLVRIPPTRPSLCSAMVAQLTFNQWVVGSNPTGGIMDIDIRDECVALSFAENPV